MREEEKGKDKGEEGEERNERYSNCARQQRGGYSDAGEEVQCDTSEVHALLAYPPSALTTAGAELDGGSASGSVKDMRAGCVANLLSCDQCCLVVREGCPEFV